MTESQEFASPAKPLSNPSLAAALQTVGPLFEESPRPDKSATAIVQGTGAPPSTPTEYEIMTESCDWCLIETAFDDDGIFGSQDENYKVWGLSSTESEKAITSMEEATPKVSPDAGSVNLRPRHQTLSASIE
jgi:hypothetical protein